VDITLACETLSAEKLTLCVARNGQVIAQDIAHGILPVARLYKHRRGELTGGAAADRLIGKAAAIFWVALGVCTLHTMVLSSQAAQVLQQAGITCTHDTMVETIENRTGTDLCPMEKLAAPLTADHAPQLLAEVEAFFAKQGVDI